MSKVALKKAIFVEQGGVDPLTQEPLDANPALIDTDRKTPKAEGGTYDERANVRVLNPRSHMERHGTLRERAEALDTLKSTFDDRVQMMKLMLKENNQLLAYGRRTDHVHPETQAFLEAHLKPIEQRIAEIDKQLAKILKTYPDPLVQTALKVPGIGPITVAALTAYIDFHKMVCNRCKHLVKKTDTKDEDSDKTLYCKCAGEITLVHACSTPSALWKYVGLHVASHERYVKGEAGGGNKPLRTVLYNTACTLMKLTGDAADDANTVKNSTSVQRSPRFRSPYRGVYDRTKLRLSQSEKIVKSRNTQGKLVEVAWKSTKPSHRHGAALRAIVKHLLADYWYVGRTLAGLPTVPLYVEAVLGHTHIVSPRERGWEF